MKNFKISILIIFVLMIAVSACSKKGADKMIGKWKMEKIDEMEKRGITFNVVYEFSKSKIIMDVSISHKIEGRDTVMTQPKIEADYNIKSDDGTNVVIEAIHPVSKEKAEMKLKFENEKMVITNPDNSTSSFSKM
jgi:hypothetical protein